MLRAYIFLLFVSLTGCAGYFVLPEINYFAELNESANADQNSKFIAIYSDMSGQALEETVLTRPGEARFNHYIFGGGDGEGCSAKSYFMVNHRNDEYLFRVSLYEKVPQDCIEKIERSGLEAFRLVYGQSMIKFVRRGGGGWDHR